MLQDFGPGHNMAWIAEEQFQQAELGVGEVDALTATRHLTAVGVNHQFAETKHALARRKFTAFDDGVTAANATERRCDAGLSFLGADGLWKRLVCA